MTEDTIHDLRTPSLVLDHGILRRNLDRMTGRAAELGVALRPHMKTAKCLEAAALATEGQAGGITVSTLAEAEAFADAGYRDILYGVGITPDKLDAVAAIQVTGARVAMILDDPEAAKAVVDRAAALDGQFAFLIEIDSGQHRAGLPPDDPRVPEVAEIIDSGGNAEMLGVMTHAGHSYNCTKIAEIQDVAAAERDAVVAAAGAIHGRGLACPVVSIGSTPTALHARDLTGVTEMRPGVYMFGDLYQLAIGSCDQDDIALSVMTAVVGRRPAEGRALIDAGALALSQDRGWQAPGDEACYGIAVDIDGRPLPGPPRIVGVNQEHGFLTGLENGVEIGQRLRVLPNHACSMAAMYDRYHVVDGGTEIVAVWQRINGW
jgi:D-serine deaminase-like pyridoxal phosphate-dependent protein